jgi:hypothetical protein
MLRVSVLGVAAALLVACSGADGPQGGTVVTGDCVGLYKRFDFAKQTMSTPIGMSDRAAIPFGLQSQIAALQQHNCLTRPNDLTFAAEPVPVTESGASIPPATIHAGVVTDMAAEAQALEYFQARGIKTLSVGQAGLGRRIYIGAFTTSGGRDAALSAARAAGFEWPYVIDYGPYMRP